MAGILVLGELTEGKMHSITAELLAAGRGLSGALGEEVVVAFQGQGIPDGISSQAIAQGADRVYLVEHQLLSGPLADAHLAAFEEVCRGIGPSVVLVGRTPLGRDIGPRLAFRLGVGMAQDCTDVRIDPATRRVVVTRPVYGGNAMARLSFPQADPQIVVLRGKVFDPLPSSPARTGQVERLQPNLDPSAIKTRLVEVVKQQAQGMRLEDAPVVVGGGRGLGGPEPFRLLEELAALLGGAVGASRAVCDAGWMDHSYQVGLTGKTITPNLYITVGISGASQHMAGCSGARHIVAINKDPDANIFKEASFGVVGDWRNVLPSFIETVRELVKS